jgi:ubiquinone/menaquinone biosynthesis C-methylase UbiE
MRRLAGVLELLDGPLDDPAALRGNLRDLARVNRWLGGTRLSTRAVDVLLDGRLGPQSVLDVGTGGADIPVALLETAARRGRSLRVTGLDARSEVIAAAHALNPRLDSLEGLELAVSDGRTLPYDNRSFDVVHASLMLHHLEPPEAIAFLLEARRVARRGVVVNDLVRARPHLLLAKLLFSVGTRNPYTRNDGPLSVRRAYTRVELRALLASAGLRPVHEASALLGHRVALAAMAIPPGGGR